MTRFHDPLARTGNALKIRQSLGIQTIGQLLRHYPRRYVKRGDLTDLASLRVGEYVTLQAEVVESKVIPHGRRRAEVTVSDGTGKLRLVFFNRADYTCGRLQPGRIAWFSGQVSVFRGKVQLTHPEYELDDDEDAEYLKRDLIPIYPASKAIASPTIAKVIRAVLRTVERIDDPIPETLRSRYDLIGLNEALTGIHQPDSWADVQQARKRLRWDEAFLLQLLLAQRRHAARADPAVPRRTVAGGLLDAFDDRCPFTLTAGQRDVSEVILREIAGEHPMHRLLQGEVGSGKTVVALRAMLAVVDAGGQAVLLAPTEVLAHQHARSIAALLGPLALAGQLGGDDRATAIALLTGSLGAASRQAALDNISTGAAGIVVGTHALLERGVEFHDLGLVVVDEQHRFGVEQRDVLRTKASKPPHVLVMTATPIPRTVAMTIFGDLETSALTELPKGRAPIATTVVPVHDKPGWVDRIWERVHEEVGKGHQAYVVCPRIGTDQGLTEEEVAAEPADRISSVTETVAELRDGPLKDLRVDVMHGRLPAEVKDDVMRRFSAGGLDVLVSTTVIEVGVDVPNATVMVIMDADRFGVSQLHQLRGRVGRGDAPGLCLLVTETPPGHPARERLDAVAGTLDGFALAELDLEQRREGDILGAAQSGRRSSLRLLEVLRDVEVIQHAREAAFDLVEADPHLRNHPGLAGAVAAFVDEQRAEYLEKA